jgi:tetratricopeptide (TPR) repeat protein
MKTLLLLLALLSHCVWADLQTAIDAYEQGNDEQARTLFTASQEQPQAKLYLARIWQSEDLDIAESWVNKALKQDPDNPLAHFVKGSVMANQASNSSIFLAYGYARDSLKAFKRAVELAPDNVQFRFGLMQYYAQAPGIAGGSEKKALQQVKEIEKLKPLAGLKARLSYLKSTENSADYDRVLSAARQQYPDKADFHYMAALDLQAHQQYTQALALFERASALTSAEQDKGYDNFHALYQVGRTAVLAEDFIERGIAALQSYLEHAPDNRQLPEKYWARFRLANLLALSGNNHKAEQIYQSLLTIADKQLREQVKKQLQQS